MKLKAMPMLLPSILVLVTGFAIVAFASDPKSVAGQAVAKAKAAVVTAKTLDSKPADKPVEGTVVIKSSQDSEDDPYADENSSEDKPVASLSLTKDPKTDLLTVDAPGEDIRSLVRKVADLYSLNIVIPAGLNGSTTLKLTNVSWKQLFEVMLPPAGYAYTEANNIIQIKSKEEVSAEPTDTRVFLINYANAHELLAAITPLVDTTNGGKIQVDKRSNALVVTEKPSKFNNIKDIIDRLDKSTPQVLIETKFIDIDDTNDKNLGVNWSSLSSYKLKMESLDRTWSRDPSASGVKKTITDTAVFSAPEFDIVLSALSTLSGSHLVSNPTVVTLNNTEATINIGEEYPIPQYTYNQQQGTFEVSGFEYKPIGVNLKVTPQVNSQGYITLTVAPELSAQGDPVTFGGTTNGASIPIIVTRKVTNTVTIKDGNTIALGGLIQTTTSSSSNKIPVLGDIPLAGGMFRSSGKKVERRNLIIFITARTVNPDGGLYDTVDARQFNDLKLSASDLPGHKVSAEEESVYRTAADKREAARTQSEMKNVRREIKSIRVKNDNQPVVAPAASTSADLPTASRARR